MLTNRLHLIPEQCLATAPLRSFRLGLALQFLLALAWASTVQAQYDTIIEGDGVTISGYTGTGGDVVIPPTLRSLWVRAVGERAFENNTNVSSVTIPGSVTSIGSGAFHGCTELKSFRVGSGSSTYASLDGVLLSKDMTRLILYPPGKQGGYLIPNTVTDIGEGAFQYCTGLTSVTIPDSVTSISDYAFIGCSSLTSVTVPDSVTSIGSSAFYGCTALTNVVIPNSVTDIGDEAFRNCKEMFSMTLPTSITSIGDYTFLGCTKLTSVLIPGNVTSIGWYSFYGCTALTNVAIPDTLASIGNLAFYGCSALTSVTIPGSVTSIGGYTFYGCTALTNVTIPEGVTSIDRYAFASCTGLTMVKMPESLTSIGWAAFKSCTGLTNVYLADSLTYIGYSAFRSCTGLLSLTIPRNVTSITARAFEDCTGLTDFTVDSDNPTFASLGGVLSSKDMTRFIVFPPGKSGAYLVPNSVTNVGSWAFDRCARLTSITVGSDHPTFASLDGVLFSKDMRRIIVYPDGKLGDYMIPDSVAEVRSWAFRDCAGLTSVTIPNSVASIRGPVFFGCTGLTDFTVDSDNPTFASLDGVLFSKDMARLIIYPAGRLGSYLIPGSIAEIDSWAFQGCAGLTSVTIPNSVSSIGMHSFSGCTGLTRVLFLGDAPAYNIAFRDTQAIIYHLEGTTGWGSIFGGRPTLPWSTRIVSDDGQLSIMWGHFTFTLAGTPGGQVVVEGCDQLDPLDWQPLSTNTFDTQGLRQFIDPTPADRPSRMYRLTVP